MKYTADRLQKKIKLCIHKKNRFGLNWKLGGVSFGRAIKEVKSKITVGNISYIV